MSGTIIAVDYATGEDSSAAVAMVRDGGVYTVLDVQVLQPGAEVVGLTPEGRAVAHAEEW